MELKIVGFKESTYKEDNTCYYPLNIKEFIDGKILWDKKIRYDNIYHAIDTKLVEADIFQVEDNIFTLDDFNSTHPDFMHNKQMFCGLICAGFVYITLDGRVYKNLYLLAKNSLNMISHIRVQSKFMIKKHIKDDIYDVIL